MCLYSIRTTSCNSPVARTLVLGLAALTVASAVCSPGVRTAMARTQESRPADQARAEKAKQEYNDGAAVRSRLVVRRMGQGQGGAGRSSC